MSRDAGRRQARALMALQVANAGGAQQHMSHGDADQVAAQLSSFFAHTVGQPVTVSSVERAALGQSCETWFFDLDWRNGGQSVSERLALRRDPESGGLLQTERGLELHVLQAMADTPVPAPVVRFEDLEGRFLDRPSVITRREPGVCDYLVLAGPEPVAERRRLAEGFCDLLADVHDVDWRRCGLGLWLSDPGVDAATASVDNWTTVLHHNVGGAYPELAAAELWLREHAPASSETVLVHGDFKPGNALIENGSIVALLDWETAGLGDFHEDLGWVTQPLRRNEHFIPGVWEQDEIVAHYERRRGVTVDLDALAWWQIFATYKTAVIQLTGFAAYVNGESNRLYREPAECLRLLVGLLAGDSSEWSL